MLRSEHYPMEFKDRRSTLSDCIFAMFILKEISPNIKRQLCMIYVMGNDNQEYSCPIIQVEDKVYTGILSIIE